MNASRWVESELAGLKREADEAGTQFREARKRCFHSNLQYYFYRELMKIRPLSIFASPLERGAQANIEALGRVRHWDAERQAARTALDDAKLKLEKSVTGYRAAKSRSAEKHDG